jgi:hypothetical protein
MQLYFCDEETTFNYYEATRRYLGNYGKPVAFYSDKFSVFRVNRKEAVGGIGVTQFARGLSELNIDIICANSAPAKGRVERANLTLQDRLIKELRLNNITGIDAANAFAPTFISDYNNRFAKAAHNPFDAHRSVLESERLDEIFTLQETRKVSQSLSFNYQRQLYLFNDTEETRLLTGKRVTVYESEDGSVHVRHDGKTFPLRRFGKDDAQITQAAIVSNKHLAGVLQAIKDKQQKKDLEKLSKPQTKRKKRLLEQRIKAGA